MRKRKIGILLILIGIGIPLILFFFQDEYGDLLTIRRYKTIERNLSPAEIDIVKSKRIHNRVYSIEEDTLRTPDLILKDENYLEKEIWIIRSRIEIPIYFRKSVGMGILILFVGIGMVIFSFFPEKPKPKKQRD